MISSPFLASISLPSRVNFTVSSMAMRTCSVFDVHEEFVAEHADGGHDGAGDGWSQRTDRRLPRWPRQAGSDVVTDVEQQVEIGVPALSLLDAQEHLLQPAAAFAARRALTT